MDLKQNSCVDINVFVKCEEEYKHECHCEKLKKDNETCVNINVFVECEEKEEKE